MDASLIAIGTRADATNALSIPSCCGPPGLWDSKWIESGVYRPRQRMCQPFRLHRQTPTKYFAQFENQKELPGLGTSCTFLVKKSPQRKRGKSMLIVIGWRLTQCCKTIPSLARRACILLGLWMKSPRVCNFTSPKSVRYRTAVLVSGSVMPGMDA